MSRHPRSDQTGLTLIELMVVVALIAIVIGLVAPSFKRMIESQRVQSINSQLVTDLQLARSEAVSRGAPVRITFGSDSSKTCYTLYTYNLSSTNLKCNCLLDVPCAAGVGLMEIHTTRVDVAGGVSVVPNGGPNEFAFDAVAGAVFFLPADRGTPAPAPYPIKTSIDVSRSMVTTVGLTGRPTVCAPTGSKMQVPAC